MAVPVLPSWGAPGSSPSQRDGRCCIPPGHPTALSLHPKAGVLLQIPVPGGSRDLSGWRGLTGCCRDPQPWLRRGGAVMARGTAVPHRLGSCPQVVMHLLRKQSRVVAELPANQTPHPAVRGDPGQRLCPQQAGSRTQVLPSAASGAALALGCGCSQPGGRGLPPSAFLRDSHSARKYFHFHALSARVGWKGKETCYLKVTDRWIVVLVCVITVHYSLSP